MTNTKFTIVRDNVIADVPRRIYGGFVEHLGRSVYNGIFEPDHPTADPEGFRGDVLEAIKELGVTTIRYPGGNFVSGFEWEDSVGPKEERPTRLDLAWHSIETNQVGLHEFASWLEKIESELMLALNLGTRGTADALNLLEYTNLDTPTKFAKQRVENGRVEPFNVGMWCLGNELDGPWQLGHKSADDYGRLAAEVAAAMRQMQPNLELVACGSSKPTMATFPDWELTVLDHTYEHIDFISCHAYYEELDDDVQSHVASGVNMEGFIHTLKAAIEITKVRKRSTRTVNISFDEWNIWANKRWHQVDKPANLAQWRVAPPILEDIYTRADALAFGGMLIALLNNVDVVRSASLAQLVNVIAPIMTVPGGGLFKQSIFHPFAVGSKHFNGEAIRVVTNTATLETDRFGEVPQVVSAATFDSTTGQLSVMFLNHHLTEATETSIELQGFGSNPRIIASMQLTPGDLHSVNSIESPKNVDLVPLDSTIENSSVTVSLAGATWGYVIIALEVE